MSGEVEDSPGRQALVAMNEVNKEVIFKKPNFMRKRKKAQKVLDEDTYVEEMGKIIERDFFPDLEKLKAQNEYLEAVEKNDVIKMRELHLKYTEKKVPSQRIPSPATFETPANIHNTQGPQFTEPEPSIIEDVEKTKKRLSLDQYLNSHTSEDNQSFEEIMVESEVKHRAKFAYLYNEEDKSEIDREKLLALPSIAQQALLPEKKLNIDTWGYKNRNYIMYVPDGVEPTPEEAAEINKKRHEIVHNNTRISVNPFNEVQSKETITELAKKQAKVLDGKIGVDGKELVPGTPKIMGFSLIKDPSPCPGVAQSPFMTWGEIEGTPFRLDGSDTPLPRNQGPSFKMNEPPKREQLAFALAEKASERHRDKKRKAMDAARRQFASPSPRGNYSTVDRLATMSPAAQRLASSRLKLGLCNSDLRSVYTPSPSPRKTPSRHSTGSITPKLNLGIKKADNLTDDLLQIKLPKRQKAADFF